MSKLAALGNRACAIRDDDATLPPHSADPRLPALVAPVTEAFPRDAKVSGSGRRYGIVP
jgi:hypothetical protein